MRQAAQYRRFWQVLLLPDGGFLVSHRDPVGVDLYDPEGQFVRSIGSEGPGSDQYVSASSMVMAHDTLVVADGRRGRIMLYTLEGALLGSFFVDIHADPIPMSLDPKGRLRLQENIGGLGTDRFKWVTFTMQGSRVDSIVSPLEVRPPSVVAGPPGPVRSRILLPYHPSQGAVFLADGTLVYGVGDKYDFVVTRTGPDTVRMFRRTGLTPQPFPAGLADSVIADMMKAPPGGMLPQLSAKDFPSVFPIWNEIAIDTKGYLWVSLGYWSRRNHYFDVFAPDGRYLGYVTSRFEYLRNASWNGDRVAITTYDRNRLPVVRTFTIDRRESRDSAHAGNDAAVSPQGARSFSWGDSRSACAVYAAALLAIRPDSTRPLVIADSNSMGTPSFAFHAWTGMPRPRADTGMVLTDSLIRAMNAANQPRADLPACVRQRAGVKTESYATLMAPFVDQENGWKAFADAHPRALGFLVLSRPLWLSPSQDEALLYVAGAADWLVGSGVVLYMRRLGDSWTLVKRFTLWLS